MAGIYIHVPFCRRRCSYCDFYFVTSNRSVGEFVDAVCTEIRLRSRSFGARERIETLYFGGGTPSRLTTDQLDRIVQAVMEGFDLRELNEVTIEVNPDDPDEAYLERLRVMGFTRLSIGVQSLHEGDLRFMQRSHTAEQAKSFVERARAVGFPSLSIDLIFGLPDTTSERWRSNLEYAAESGAQHVSLYGLTVEPRTVLGKWVKTGRVVPAPEAVVEEQFRVAHDVITARGFEHYEISNFAKPGHRSRHNQSYWNHTNYLGFGPSAHSFWRNDRPLRWENARSLSRYIESLREGVLPVSGEETLDADTLMCEYVLLGLRTDSGVDLTRLRERYGYRMSDAGWNLLVEMERAGKLSVEGERIRLTLDGMLVADSITSMLLDKEIVEPI